jgi:hypothetical protein
VSLGLANKVDEWHILNSVVKIYVPQRIVLSMTERRGSSLRRAILCLPASILVVCLLVPAARATIILFIFTPQGIIVGADSKSRSPAAGTSHEAFKVLALQNRIAVASMGLTDFHLNIQNRITGQTHSFAYEFQPWIVNIEKTLPPDIEVSQLAEIVANRSKAMLGEFNGLMKSGQVKREDFPTSTLANFFVAGYEKNLVRIYEIDYFIDWDARSVTGPVSKLLANAEWGFVVPAGITTTSEVLKGSGKSYDEAMEFDPIAIRKLVKNEEPLTLVEAANAIRILMKIEAERVPQAVGPPYRLVIIPPHGPAEGEVYNSH